MQFSYTIIIHFNSSLSQISSETSVCFRLYSAVVVAVSFCLSAGVKKEICGRVIFVPFLSRIRSVVRHSLRLFPPDVVQCTTGADDCWNQGLVVLHGRAKTPPVSHHSQCTYVPCSVGGRSGVELVWSPDTPSLSKEAGYAGSSIRQMLTSHVPIRSGLFRNSLPTCPSSKIFEFLKTRVSWTWPGHPQ